MARKDVSTLRDEAVKAVERGKWKQALEAYAELERRQPADAQWPKRAGEVLRKSGDAAGAVAAFERAADRYVQAGFLVQAIAVCKLILQLDPAHSATVTRLGELSPARPAPPAREVDVAPGAPLASVPLAEVVAGARRELVAGRPSGVTVIPIAAVKTAVSDPEARRAVATTPLFSGLPPRVLEDLIQRMGIADLAAGDVLFREGEPGTCLYIVSEGEVAVETGAGELARLGPGSFFGEVGLVTDLPRSATIRAATAVEVLSIDRAVVREVVARHPEVLGVLLGFVRDRLVDRVLRTSELFRPFAEAERRDLAGRFELVEVEPATPLIVAGARADGLYVVLAGAVEVWRDGEAAPVATLGPGEVFGEISLLAGGGSSAHVRAATKVLALRMPARTFQEVIMTHPQVLAYVGELAARRQPSAGEGGGEDLVDLHLDLL